MDATVSHLISPRVANSSVEGQSVVVVLVLVSIARGRGGGECSLAATNEEGLKTVETPPQVENRMDAAADESFMMMMMSLVEERERTNGNRSCCLRMVHHMH